MMAYLSGNSLGQELAEGKSSTSSFNFSAEEEVQNAIYQTEGQIWWKAGFIKDTQEEYKSRVLEEQEAVEYAFLTDQGTLK